MTPTKTTSPSSQGVHAPPTHTHVSVHTLLTLRMSLLAKLTSEKSSLMGLLQSMVKRQGTHSTGLQSIICNTETHRTSNQQHTLIPKDNLEYSIKSQVFGLGEEARVSRENPPRHGERLQTPCGKTPCRDSNPGPYCCKTVASTTFLEGQSPAIFRCVPCPTHLNLLVKLPH